MIATSLVMIYHFGDTYQVPPNYRLVSCLFNKLHFQGVSEFNCESSKNGFAFALRRRG